MVLDINGNGLYPNKNPISSHFSNIFWIVNVVLCSEVKYKKFEKNHKIEQSGLKKPSPCLRSNLFCNNIKKKQ